MIPNDFYLGNIVDKPLSKDSAVNVIYFTNKCNLACTYCYEDLANRPSQILSQSDIRTHIDSIIEREDPDEQTLIVLFGGEPTLEWDNVIYLMDYAYDKKSNIHFNITTNGIKFLSTEFVLDVKNNIHYAEGRLSIDISFDGIGNAERVFENGQKSTASMIKVFTNLNKHSIKFRIRYTIHDMNAKHSYGDISRIIKTFKPERLITSVAWDKLNEDDITTLSETKELFRTDWINRIIDIPVCEFFCDMCDGCSNQKELKTYFTDDGNVRTIVNGDNAPVFKDFKDKEQI